MDVRHQIEIKTLATDDAITVFWEKPQDAKTGDCYAVSFATEEGQRVLETGKTHITAEGMAAMTRYQIALTRRNGDDVQLLWSGTAVTAGKKRIIRVDQPPYQASGDGSSCNTKALQQALDDCDEGSVVYIPKGVFLTGALWMHSNSELYLEKGAILQGTSQPEDYLPMIPSRFEGIERSCYQSLLNVGTLDHEKGCTSENIFIHGEGTISGGGRELAESIMALGRKHLKEELEKSGEDISAYECMDTIPGRVRGRLINISNTRNARISGLTLQNGPAWNLHMIYSENIVTDHCIFRSKNIWNGDGWDPDSSKNCILFACEFETGDDAVAVKSGKNPEGKLIGRSTEHIRIFDCHIVFGHGIAIGSEMSGGIRDVKIWDCDLSNATLGLDIKGTQKRGGFVREITVRDCVLPRVMIHSVGYNDDGKAAPEVPDFGGILFLGCTFTCQPYDEELERKVTANPFEIKGFAPDHPIHDVRIQDSRILMPEDGLKLELSEAENVWLDGLVLYSRRRF